MRGTHRTRLRLRGTANSGPGSPDPEPDRWLSRGPSLASRPRGPRVAKAIGGVTPVGHPEPLPTIIDISLSRYDQFWAAGGHPHYVFPTSYGELLRITGGEAAEVSF
jgi:hypothetical protein